MARPASFIRLVKHLARAKQYSETHVLVEFGVLEHLLANINDVAPLLRELGKAI
jgi:hypothetical protein